MTRRKLEITGLANEQDFPHLVELALPPEGFRGVLLEMDAFHRERRIPVRRGRSRHEVKQVYIRFCYAEPSGGKQRLPHRQLMPVTRCADQPRSGRKKARMSSASSSGCSIAAKWPPRGITVQRRILV